MNNKNYTKKLENIIKQMLKPLKDIPFNLVIEAMTGRKVISFDFAKSEHKEVLELLKKSAIKAGNEINKTGLQKIYDSPDCFKSIKKYMRDERSEVIKENNFKTIEEFNLYIRKVTDTSSVVDHHYFADSQYVFPTEEMYKKLQTTGFWRREYEELRREYEELRRPFNNELKLTDVIKFSQEGHKIKKYDHETVKPEALTTALIEKCSRKGDLVVIPFSGSGTECAMSAKSSRDFIAYDIEKKYADMSNERASHEISQGILF